MGNNTYRTLPSGCFESTSEEKIANVTINSKLTGKITDGLLTEYELVNNQGGSEVKVTAKEGKAQINKQGNTYEVDFKPAKVLFANDPFARIISGSYSYLAHDPFVSFGVIHAWLLRF